MQLFNLKGKTALITGGSKGIGFGIAEALLQKGMKVAITQARDSGDAAVTGIVHAVDRDRVVILREAPECGRVPVHFPRVGMRVSLL